MTAQIQYFCDSNDEQAVLDRLTADKAIAVFELDGQRMTEIPEFSVGKIASLDKSNSNVHSRGMKATKQGLQDYVAAKI